jgi:hypothetical protein
MCILASQLIVPDQQDETMSGFLWMKQKGTWNRYFCVADGNNLEWFSLGNPVSLPLASCIIGSQLSSDQNDQTTLSISAISRISKIPLDTKEQGRLRKKSDHAKSACLERMKQQSSHKLSLFAGEDQIFSMATHRPLTFESLTTHVIAIKWLSQFGDKCPPLVLDDDIMIDPTLIPLPVGPSGKSSPLLGRRNRLVRKKSEPANMSVIPIAHKSESGLRSAAARPASASDGLIRSAGSRSGSSSDDDNDESSDPSEGGTVSYCAQLESSPLEETAETTRMRNEFREMLEKAQNEAGRTPFGNRPLPPRDKRRKSPAASPSTTLVPGSCDEALQSQEKGEEEKRKPYLILSLDGGGVRSIITAVVLERLVQVFPDLMERVALFAGCSGGSKSAMLLATGRSPTFVRQAMYIFNPALLVPRNVRQFHGYPLRHAKYSNQMLKVCLEETLNCTYRELPSVCRSSKMLIVL